MVLHFPSPAFSSLAVWCCIFQVSHFPALRSGAAFSKSRIFLPCGLVPHFPSLAFSCLAVWCRIFQVSHFPALRSGAVFSSLAFSCLAVWCRIFQFLHFPALLFFVPHFHVSH